MRKKIIQMTVYGWEAWAQSHKWPFKPLWKSWVQMWWRNLSTCVALPHLHSEPSQRVPAEPVEFLRAQGCIEHNSALCATPSPHWLMDARCRGISAANSQQPPGKCWDNLWFHSWLSTPFPIPVPAWLMVSVLAPRPLTPQRQNSASLLCPTIVCCPIHHPTMSCFVGSSPKMLDLGLWVKTPNHTLHSSDTTAWTPHKSHQKFIKRSTSRFPAQVGTGGNKDYNRKQKTKSGK